MKPLVGKRYRQVYLIANAYAVRDPLSNHPQARSLECDQMPAKSANAHQIRLLLFF
jgi:hypothetical protein